MRRLCDGTVYFLICAASFLATALSATAPLAAQTHALHTFRKIQLTDKFWTEAPSYGDLNQDGRQDIVVGPYWFEGPSFKHRHEFYPAVESFTQTAANGKAGEIEGYGTGLGSDRSISQPSQFSTVIDLNGDGWPDILITSPRPTPKDLIWYENPGKRSFTKSGYWRRHVVASNVDNQSATLVDLFGNGRPVFVAMTGGQNGHHGGRAGYFQADPKDATQPWKFHPISWETDEFQWFTHGLGAGDINGDGRKDILHSDGWWEQPASLVNDPVWNYHAYPFNIGPGQIKQYSYRHDPSDPLRIPMSYDLSEDGVPTPLNIFGGSIMHVDDVNEDGLADVICSITAHAYGLAWWEQFKGKGGATQFRRHLIVNRPGDSPYGVSFTEMQAVAWADVDGDGRKDIVTGKRFWSHRDWDPGATDPSVLYWFRQTRAADGSVDFIPYQIDDDSGAGNQVAVGDVNGDGTQDILVANKKGAFAFLQIIKPVSKEAWLKAQPPVASPELGQR